MTEGSFTTCGQAPYDEDEDHISVEELDVFEQERNRSTESLIEALDEMFTTGQIRGQDGLLGSGLVATLLTVFHNLRAMVNPWVDDSCIHIDRGFNHELTGSLLCPAGMDWSDPETKENLRSGDVLVCRDQWPIFLYAQYIYDPDDPWCGLLRGRLLAYKHVFTFSSSVEKEPKATRSRNARLHGMTCFTIASISHIATQPSEWKIFITRLNEQLQNLNFLGTVLLGVGFLAIQSVDSGAGRSPTQIASYMSLVLSFGSIALGLTFITLDLTGRDRGSEASRFLQRMNDGKHGLEAGNDLQPPLRIAYVEFSYVWCKPGNAVSRSIVGTVLFTVCGLVWCISVASDKRAPWWWGSDQPETVSKVTIEETNISKRSDNKRHILASWLRAWFTTTKKRVSVVSVRSAHSGPPLQARDSELAGSAQDHCDPET
ncbi:hypothetical protein EDD22DRAFT_988372 [Suillus occidentalis]|nr:hypothetical protein EDD22DRAFT_988372 [Suillus occidentalis]